jgi:hypothetical protein
LLLLLEARIEHLYCHLDVGGQTGDRDELSSKKAMLSPRLPDRRETIKTTDPLARRTGATFSRLHNFDMTRAHLANLIDLLTSLANDGPDKFVGDIDLLRLAAGSVGGRDVSRSVGPWKDGGSIRVDVLLSRGRSVSLVGGYTLGVFLEDGTNVIDSDVDRVGYTRDGQDALRDDIQI